MMPFHLQCVSLTSLKLQLCGRIRSSCRRDNDMGDWRFNPSGSAQRRTAPVHYPEAQYPLWLHVLAEKFEQHFVERLCLCYQCSANGHIARHCNHRQPPKYGQSTVRARQRGTHEYTMCRGYTLVRCQKQFEACPSCKLITVSLAPVPITCSGKLVGAPVKGEVVGQPSLSTEMPVPICVVENKGACACRQCFSNGLIEHGSDRFSDACHV